MGLNVELSNMAWLNTDELKPEQLERLKKLLTVRQKPTSVHSVPTIIITYVEDRGNHRIGVPLHFYLKTRPKDDQLTIDLSHGEPIVSDMEFKGELREKQIPAYHVFLEKIKEPMFFGGFLSMGCGTGKTVLAIKLISKLQKKTLVIVHKEFLVNQWTERIQQFMPSVKVGKIQQDDCFTDGCDIVIGMIHSLASREYKGIYNKFGIVIGDECLSYDTKVMTIGGYEYMGQIVEKFKNGEKISVLSFDEKTGKKEYRPVVDAVDKGVREVIEIEVENGQTIRCTPEHKFFTLNRGWVEAVNLNESDDIC